MKSINRSRNTYLRELQRRKKESRAYTSYQLLGLELAKILNDEKHKTLYIKLAKDNDPTTLLELAKSVAERKGVLNRGAYFMRLFAERNDKNRSS